MWSGRKVTVKHPSLYANMVKKENKAKGTGERWSTEENCISISIQANSLTAEGHLRKPALFSKDIPAEQLNSTDTSRQHWRKISSA